MTQSAPTQPSALAAIKALSKKAATPAAPSLSVQVSDPAIAGAKRDKNVVKLGLDPAFTETARRAAELKEAVDRATAEFAVKQSEMRDYGKSKRDAYNDAYRCVVTTVCVPYSVEVPGEGDGATPGRETRHVQVVCTSKYSVNQETVARLEPELGQDFQRLFKKEETKVLRPDAEGLFRNLLTELGLAGEDLDGAMSSLFETKTSYSTKDGYEQDVRTLDGAMQFVLEQAVTRQQPGLKFPR